MNETAPTPRLAVAHLDLPAPVHLHERATLQDAATAMMRSGVTAVLLDADEPSIVTEFDLVRATALGRPPDSAAIQVATTHPLSIAHTTPLNEAASLMLHKGVRHLVVLDEHGDPCAILSIRAAAEALLPSADLPSWLPALRLALRVEWPEGPAR